MNKVTRGERVLHTMVERHAITQSGADWLIAAVDPFHDKQLANLAGWPDLENGSSVVRCIKMSTTLKRPTTVPSTDNWDCHLIMWPWLTAGLAQFTETANRAGQTFTFDLPPTSAASIGGMQAYGCASGDNLSILLNGTTREVGRLDLDNTFTNGAGRLVGMGFEIHNTTAQLTKQGSVAVYRQMSNGTSSSVFVGTSVGAGAGPVYPVTGTPVRYPPANLQDALLLQGTRQWEAAEGCYVVAAFDEASNPAYPIQPMIPIISALAQEDSEGVISNNPFNFPLGGTPILGTVQMPCFNFRVHPIHQSGAIFTGLSPTTTLTLNWNVYYESFPGLAQADLLPLATPSCGYDAEALAVFEHILQDLPVGVMVKENGLGDWFLGAISDAANFISPLLMASANPLAMGGGAVLKYVGDTAKAHRKPPQTSWENESGNNNPGFNYQNKKKPKPKQKAQQVKVEIDVKGSKKGPGPKRRT